MGNASVFIDKIATLELTVYPVEGHGVFYYIKYNYFLESFCN